MFIPRPKQRDVLKYTHGRMGVSAVPGSGKTQVLSALAAQLIASGELGDDQEVLIVTLVNSAVENFSQRIAKFVQERGLLPNLGYRVRTLHGLAHDIVRERPALVGLSDDFQIIDDRLAEQIIQDAAQSWLRSHPSALEECFDPDLEDTRRDWVRREKFPEMVNALAANFIRSAKDRQTTAEGLRQHLDGLPASLPLAEMGCAIYADYERALIYRGAVDFDDLIRLALRALQSDARYLERLREQWPYILEDEAQDSSRLQETILALLSGADERPAGNWVRVGDPNQAIYETFTTASPKYLKEFLERPGVRRLELPNSGRSTRSIIKLANYLIDWTASSHPWGLARGALALPHIKPTPRGDPQPNPPDAPEKITLSARKYTPQEEVLAVADSLERWLPEHPDQTVAVLTPRNQRGFDLVQELKRRKIEYVEILRSTDATRMAAGALGNLLACLADPQSPGRLATAYRVWRRADREDETLSPRLERVSGRIRKCSHVEDYLWPRAGRDWLEDLYLAEEHPEVLEELAQFRQMLQRWQGAALLPVDQLVLTLAQDLFNQPADLAVSHKLAILLRRAAASHSDWRLPEMTEELAMIARNERRFLGFSDDDTGFDPERYKGKAVIATIHKAKGLEWDRVYLMSVNNYDFPSGQPNDRYFSEKWFIRDRLDLEAEALAQLGMALSQDESAWVEEGAATQQARLDTVNERLRLLYVGITRARQELVITWNTGRTGEAGPALACEALRGFWEQQM